MALLLLLLYVTGYKMLSMGIRPMESPRWHVAWCFSNASMVHSCTNVVAMPKTWAWNNTQERANFAPRMHQHCTKNAPSLHQERTENAPTSRQECTNFAPRTHQLCTKNAPTLHQECANFAPRMHQMCTKNAPNVHQECTNFAPRMHQLCTKNTPTLHQDCTKNAPTLRQHCPTWKQQSMKTQRKTRGKTYTTKVPKIY